MHDNAVDTAGCTDGKTLHHRNNDGGHQTVPGAEGKGGNHNGNISRVVLQKLGSGEDGKVNKEHKNDREGGEQTELCKSAEFGIDI